MSWRCSQTESRQAYLKKYDGPEVELYDSWFRDMADEDRSAFLSDIESLFPFQTGMKVMDVGAGTGAFCQTLLRVPGLEITAMEPSPVMIDMLRRKESLQEIQVLQGFCDSDDDRSLVNEGTFDVIASCNLVNNLYDPLAAFRNWYHWLKPGGTVVVTDGLFDRSSWSGKWAEEVDRLPMSACLSTALTPYLLEQVGFQVQAAKHMERVNELPSTRTKRYMVVGSKPSENTPFE